MTPDEWFGRFEAALSDAIQAVPDAVGAAKTQAASGREHVSLLLDLARIAAHRSERWTAPVTTYLVGLAVGPLPSQARERVLSSLVASLDVESDADSV